MTSARATGPKTYLRPVITDLGTLADITRGSSQVPPTPSGISASLDVHVGVDVGGPGPTIDISAP